ncbi:ankyrin repeat domain-containing protein [Alloalcanivorax sp. C16-2]|uniref:ankyrin repeat domain-containing protein n=1 Tax=Alloalcanivorax sp. C16-2 TaxID=3390052 RepID=UPI0039706637
MPSLGFFSFIIVIVCAAFWGGFFWGQDFEGGRNEGRSSQDGYLSSSYSIDENKKIPPPRGDGFVGDVKGAWFSKTFQGDTLLHIAAKVSNEELINESLNARMIVDEKNGRGMTPLVLAFKYGSMEAIDKLVGAGANLAVTADGHDMMWFAQYCQCDSDLRAKKIEFLLGRGFPVIGAGRAAELLPLIKDEKIKAFLVAEINPNEKGPKGEDNFTKAIRGGADEESLRAMMSAGYDLHNTILGFSALHAGVMRNAEVSDEFYREMIEAGAPVNSRIKGVGITPLMYAVSRGNLSKARMLLNYGADPRAQDSKGLSVVDYAEKIRNNKERESMRSLIYGFM